MQLLTLTNTLFLVYSTTAAVAGAAVLAEPQHARVTSGARSGFPSGSVSAPTSDTLSNNPSTTYYYNWAGGDLNGTGFTSVTGSVLIPTLVGPGSGSAWVGIDTGLSCSVMLQAGIEWTRDSSGVTTYSAWSAWWPGDRQYFNIANLSDGETITATVTASGTTAGIATIVIRGNTLSHEYSGEGSALCQSSAEWIIEDHMNGGSYVPFANFGTLTFMQAGATDSSGNVGVGGVSIFDIEQNGVVLTDCSITGPYDVGCFYIPQQGAKFD